MEREGEIKNKKDSLNEEIKDLNYTKNEYQSVNREIDSAISDFEEMKKSIKKAQMYIREGDTSEVAKNKATEMEGDINEVNVMISSLEETKKELKKEIRKIDEHVLEKENEIRTINIELEKNKHEDRKE